MEEETSLALYIATSALAFAAMLAGCVAAARPDPGAIADSANYERQSRVITQREGECEAAVVNRQRESDAQATSIPDAAAASKSSSPESANRQSVAECKAKADREEEQLTSYQRTEYERRAREEHDRGSLMGILTGSLGH
jgi:hypothetical protein